MVAYDIIFSCKACGGKHPLGVKIQTPGGPKRKISVGAFYAEKEMPKEISLLTDHLFECPKSNNSFFHNDIYQLFLIPVE